MILMASVAFSGCFDNTLACDDEEVQKLVKDIIRDSVQQEVSALAANAWAFGKATQQQFELLKQDANNIDIKLDGFMPQNTNKEIKKITCKANTSVKYPPRDPNEIKATIFDFNELREKNGQGVVLYTAQITTDSKIYVEVLDMQYGKIMGQLKEYYKKNIPEFLEASLKFSIGVFLIFAILCFFVAGAGWLEILYIFLFCAFILFPAIVAILSLLLVIGAYVSRCPVCRELGAVEFVRDKYLTQDTISQRDKDGNIKYYYVGKKENFYRCGKCYYSYSKKVDYKKRADGKRDIIMATDIKKTNSRKLEIYYKNSYKRSLNLANDILDFVFNDYFCAILMKDKVEVYDVISGNLVMTTNCTKNARLELEDSTLFITENGVKTTYNLATNKNVAYDAGRQAGEAAFNVIGSLFKK